MISYSVKSCQIMVMFASYRGSPVWCLRNSREALVSTLYTPEPLFCCSPAAWGSLSAHGTPASSRDELSSYCFSSENVLLLWSNLKLSISFCLVVTLAFLSLHVLLSGCVEVTFSAPTSAFDVGGKIWSMSLVNSNKVPFKCKRPPLP